MTEPLRWHPSRLARSLATASATALILAVLGHRPELVVFAAPLLGALASAWRPVPTHVTVQAERPTERCFEQETVTVNLSADAHRADLALSPIMPAGLTLLRHVLQAEVVLEPVEIRVYPRPEPLRTAPRPERLPDRIGVHIGRARGEGVEFHGIRPYVAGDQLSRINWPVSVRLGRWHVTERRAERATDIVALIDTYPVTDPARSSLDLAVHGAAELVQAALKRGDRAGMLALGGSRVPRSAIPPHACVIAFSPLLDARIGLALQDIRHRGHPTLIVDVLRHAPVRTGGDPLIERVWRLQRRSLYRDLATLGIPVVPWPEGSTLDAVLHPATHRPLR